MSSLPTLDASNFSFTSDKARISFGKALAQSFRDHGFVKLINYGINEEVVTSLVDAVRILSYI